MLFHYNVLMDYNATKLIQEFPAKLKFSTDEDI